MNIATKWQITSPEGIDEYLEIKKVSYIRNSYTGDFTDLENKILDVRRGTKAEWLEYLGKCKRAVRQKTLDKQLARSV